MNKTTDKIVVGMSGGVDSSVTAKLIRERFPDSEVIGIFMQNWEEEDDSTQWCSAPRDVDDARQVCKRLGITLHTVNLTNEYWQEVFEDFLAEYRNGRTPNPDIYCNERIKFGHFLRHATDLGASCIATGHYARVEKREGQWYLLKGSDAAKDQSYFLYRLNQQHLAQTLFPVGEFHKTEIRALASQACFQNHAKKDSTGICFIGERPFRDFLSRYLHPESGEIRSASTNRVLGQHDGVWFYTLGQRQGLGIGGVKDVNGGAWYVVDKDLKNNVLYVVQGREHALLRCTALDAIRCHWIAEVPKIGNEYQCRVRHGQLVQDVVVTDLNEDHVKLSFKQAQYAVTPGQSVVLYDDEYCLGGGIIHATDKPCV